MASSPSEVTHAFALNNPILAAAILKGIQNVENRNFRIQPGWYAVSVTAGAYSSVEEEVTLREEFPELPSYIELGRGEVHGCVRIGHSLPTSVVNARWVDARYKVANVVTHVLPFAGFPSNGVPARANFGIWPLNCTEQTVRERAKSAELAGLLRKNDVEVGALQELENIWDQISVAGKLLEDGKAVKGKKRVKTKEKATKDAKKPKAEFKEGEKTPLILTGSQLVGWVRRPAE